MATSFRPQGFIGFVLVALLASACDDGIHYRAIPGCKECGPGSLAGGLTVKRSALEFWHRPLPDGGSVAALDDRLVWIDASDRVAHERSTGTTIGGLAVSGAGRVFAVDDVGEQLRSYDARGRLRWRRALLDRKGAYPTPWGTTVHVSGGTVYVGLGVQQPAAILGMPLDPGHVVVALDAESGDYVDAWAFPGAVFYYSRFGASDSDAADLLVRTSDAAASGFDTGGTSAFEVVLHFEPGDPWVLEPDVFSFPGMPGHFRFDRSADGTIAFFGTASSDTVVVGGSTVTLGERRVVAGLVGADGALRYAVTTAGPDSIGHLPEAYAASNLLIDGDRIHLLWGDESARGLAVAIGGIDAGGIRWRRRISLTGYDRVLSEISLDAMGRFLVDARLDIVSYDPTPGPLRLLVDEQIVSEGEGFAMLAFWP
ncbi:MAG: hypothetical protein U0230_02180 [Polyangiales bacterium]